MSVIFHLLQQEQDRIKGGSDVLYATNKDGNYCLADINITREDKSPEIKASTHLLYPTVLSRVYR